MNNDKIIPVDEVDATLASSVAVIKNKIYKTHFISISNDDESQNTQANVGNLPQFAI